MRFKSQMYNMNHICSVELGAQSARGGGCRGGDGGKRAQGGRGSLREGRRAQNSRQEHGSAARSAPRELRVGPLRHACRPEGGQTHQDELRGTMSTPSYFRHERDLQNRGQQGRVVRFEARIQELPRGKQPLSGRNTRRAQDPRGLEDQDVCGKNPHEFGVRLCPSKHQRTRPVCHRPKSQITILGLNHTLRFESCCFKP